MNNKQKPITLLGGDMRHAVAADELSKKGYKVNAWGIGSIELVSQNTNIQLCSSIYEATENTEVIILPLPVSTDGKYLNCPLLKNKIAVPLTDILGYIKKNTLVLGGKIPEDFCYSLKQKDARVIDYFGSEEFQVHNAYITAEAAVNLAMNNLSKNISESCFAITGYGRIAKHLVRILKNFGADVTVAARKSSDLAWAYSFGCKVIKIDSNADGEGIQSLEKGYDVIYNTVPKVIFDKDFLLKVSKNTFIIDLASAPGGVDICSAKELNSNILWASSLPGKYAPTSAGRIIANCVNSELLNEVAE